MENSARYTIFNGGGTRQNGRSGELPPTIGNNPDDPYWLSRGKHAEGEGRCANEWMAYIAGEPQTDHPACVDPFLVQLFVTLNDMFGDEDRQRLRPLLARAIGTKDDGIDRPTISSERWTAKFGFGHTLTAPFSPSEVQQLLDHAEAMLPTVRVDLPVAVVERAREVCEV